MSRNFAKNSSFLSGRLWRGLLLACVVHTGVFANPFRDVPPDHFAYEAIEKLTRSGLMGGYPDGTFKGRRVLTRYEIAVILAKMMAHMEDLKVQGQPVQVAPDNQMLMNRLSAEFRTELDLLGVRIDALEGRMQEVEEQTRLLDESLSNVHIEGYYEGSQTYIARDNAYTRYTDGSDATPGLHPLNHDVFLRFIGNPREGSRFYKDVEAFVELKANLTGPAQNRLRYDYSQNPIPGDTRDDFVTHFQDDRDVSVSKAHFRSKAPLMDLRVFSGEQFTDLKDPAVLLTASNFRIRPWLGQEGYISGIEASGRYGRTAYFGSVLKRHIVTPISDVDPENLFTDFAKETEATDDVFALRMTYDALDLEERGVKKSLILGSTFVENAKDYTTLNNFNRVIGFDATYSAKADYNFGLTLNPLLSEGQGDIHDTAFKADSQYEHGNLILTFKGYSFGKDFKTNVASTQYIDYWDGTSAGTTNSDNPDNYGRGRFNTTGERLLRGSAKYSFDESGLTVVDNLSMTLTGLVKWWEDIAGMENENWFGRKGTRVNLRTIADLNDRTHIEFFNELKKDARPDEKGRTRHMVDMDVKLNQDVSVLGSIEWITDYDIVEQDQHYTETTGSLEANARVHPRLSLKGRVSDTVGWGGRPNQFDIDILDFESNYRLWTSASWRQYLRRRTYDETADPSAYSVTDYSISELNMNFSRRFEGSVAYGWQRPEDRFGVGDDFWNWYGKLIYEPTSSTEISLTYGYDWNDSGHPGRFNFEHSAQKVTLRAQTDF